jgi:hypothetical protein
VDAGCHVVDGFAALEEGGGAAGAGTAARLVDARVLCIEFINMYGPTSGPNAVSLPIFRGEEYT